MVRFFYVKYIKNVEFLPASKGPHGPDLLSPSGRKFQFQYTLPNYGRSISRNVAEKHYDSRHDKLRKQYEYFSTAT